MKAYLVEFHEHFIIVWQLLLNTITMADRIKVSDKLTDPTQ
jgi:hypothetical protein